MAKDSVKKLTFIGRPFPSAMMDEQKTFGKVNMDMENDDNFKKFLSDNDLEDKRATMFVFGPDNFMYWYGIITDQDLIVPKEMMKYDLPAGPVASEEQTAALNYFSLPAHYLVENFFKKVMQEGIKVYQNPGDSNTPYFVQVLNLRTKNLHQFWYLDKEK